MDRSLHFDEFELYGEDRNDLREDDIAGIRSLYGSLQTTPIVIFPGQSVSGHLPKTQTEMCYLVTLQNKLLVKLEGPSGTDFDLYVR